MKQVLISFTRQANNWHHTCVDEKGLLISIYFLFAIQIIDSQFFGCCQRFLEQLRNNLTKTLLCSLLNVFIFILSSTCMICTQAKNKNSFLKRAAFPFLLKMLSSNCSCFAATYKLISICSLFENLIISKAINLGPL